MLEEEDINHNCNCRGYEVNTELQKAKKKDYLLKRHNLEIDDEPLSPFQEQNCNMSIEDVVNGINSGEESKEMTATHAASKILTRECEPPIDILINANVVPRLVEFLSRVNNHHLQLESARALTNIVSGTSDQTKAVVNAGAVAGFVSLLGSSHPVVALQAVRALGIIAIDGPELKKHITDQGALNPLINLIKLDTSSTTLLRSVAWTLSNLCRNEGSPLSIYTVRQLLPALAHLLNTNDKDILAAASMALSNLTCVLCCCYKKIQDAVDAGVVPWLVALMGHHEEAVITQSLRIINNIFVMYHGNSGLTKAFLSSSSGLIAVLGSPHSAVAEVAFLVLGFIAYDEPELRDLVIEQGILKPLLNLIKLDTPVEVLRSVTWTFWNICYNPPSIPVVRQLLPALAHLIQIDDEEILTAACQTLSFLTYSDEQIQEVVDAGVVPRLVTLLDHSEVIVIQPALNTIRDILSSRNIETDSVLAAGAYPLLAKLLVHSDLDIVEKAARIVSYIAAGNATQIQALITNNVIRPLVDVLGNGDFKCQKAAALAITNITMGGNVEQIALLCQFGAVAPLCTLLETKKPKTIVVVLDCLANILAAAKKMGELEKVSLDVRVCGGLDLIEVLVIHNNVDISHKSLAVLKQYFSTDRDEDSELAPSISQSGNYEFNTQPFQTPEGGFSF
ncbi:importin subunit alpha-5-like isoform X2 [Daphnia pulex]|uniref:importin subunit alpha-5-like isoform X2 n=1 Tax=Daphnia pulex TaxID=6669 RepID=UPI001EE14658|nr:importin subunit alpha-5-like isoform X2 [Daphnia pulex]